MPEIISKRCELVTLSDINCSGLVFLRHTLLFIAVCYIGHSSYLFSDDKINAMVGVPLCIPCIVDKCYV